MATNQKKRMEPVGIPNAKLGSSIALIFFIIIFGPLIFELSAALIMGAAPILVGIVIGWVVLTLLE